MELPSGFRGDGNPEGPPRAFEDTIWGLQRIGDLSLTDAMPDFVAPLTRNGRCHQNINFEGGCLVRNSTSSIFFGQRE